VRHPIRALTIGALAVSLLAAGCSKTGDNNGGPGSSAPATPIVIDYAGDVKGPAAPVDGAKTGGNINVLQDGDFEYLDPPNIYVSNALETTTALFHRMLTNYIEDPKGGTLKLVGDLATSAGEQSQGGKVWTYHLRDGIKFEDGSAITSQDIAYGISRAFSEFGVQGPQYVQQALDPAGAYKGPYTDGKLAPGITTPDPKTIVFTLDKPHPEWPYLMAFPTSTPVPQAKDSKEKYNTEWLSTGPYKRKEYVADTKLVLEKNPNWDPNSDPIRHQYVDTFTFDFTSTNEDQTQRVMSSAGDDAFDVMTANVDPASIPQVQADQNLMARTDSSASPFVTYLWINTTRVTDLKVRQALNYAFNRDSYIKAIGGYAVAEPATAMMAPIVPGYKKFDIYAASDGGNTGDVAKATDLLAGQKPKLKYCVSNAKLNQTVAPIIVEGLTRAGFDIAINFIPSADYYKTVGVQGTDCDLIAAGWGEDFPDGAATMDVLLNGAGIRPAGNNNLAYLNDPAVNAKLTELGGLADRSQAAAQYGALDEKIMREIAPCIPLRVTRNFTMVGSSVGGTFVSPLYAQFNLNGIYVK
jgi:peptide/nickel transport system substrate-binding protein